MVKISPFQALIANKEKLKNFSIKSYPEYSPIEIKNALKKNPISYLKIIERTKSKENQFKQIKKRLNQFKNEKILLKKQKSIYLYEQIDKQKKYVGFICGISTKDFENGHIKIHEKTIKKRQNLFTKYLETCKIHAEPILLTYPKEDSIEVFIKTKKLEKIDYEFKTNDQKTHRIWCVNTEQDIQILKQYFKKIKKMYIADGHHRIASSSLYNKSKKLNNPCLAYIVTSNQLNLESFHRIIFQSTKSEKLKLHSLLKKHVHVEKSSKILPIQKNKIKIYINKKWYDFKITPNIKTEKKIPSFVLSTEILKPTFGIKDLRNNTKIQFIPHSQIDLKKIQKQDIVIFLLPKIKIETILEMADKNKTMPPKSTYIFPKLRTGLIMMELK